VVLLKKLAKISHFIRNKLKYGFLSKLSNIKFMGENHKIESGVRIIGRTFNSITIDGDFYCNANCHFYGDIDIGKHVMIGPKTIIWSRNHNFEKGMIYKHIGHNNNKIVIGNNVWIGASVILLPGVIIPNNTVIAAGSVVTKAFSAENTVIGGNPARVLKEI
jgi:acetyltransferase-like isoleucine patch superfamily enzyme